VILNSIVSHSCRRSWQAGSANRRGCRILEASSLDAAS
jgi:hypothetical protein